MDPILGLITATGLVPPLHLLKPVESTPFFEVGPEGFLMTTPSGGRLHYSPDAGLSLADPPGRPEGDMLPFARTTGFAAAAWLDGRVPLRANAVQLTDGRLVLIASDRDDLHEAMTVALADACGLAVSDAPVVIDPEDISRVCTNGSPITLRRTEKQSTEPPVREGARRLQLDRPVIDGRVLHLCAGLICMGDGKGPAANLKELALMAAIAEIKKHVFMPSIGTAIWGADTINAAYVVLANSLPMFRFALGPHQKPSEALATDLMGQIAVQFGQGGEA
ncbi:MAG: hypothetical protein J0L76_17440 [Rhodobacterales bacterium]|nr:hypothetical protein [Rhodobacterales bacterium]